MNTILMIAMMLTRESSFLTTAGTPPNPVPFCSSSDYLHMLREAQRECSARSSARVSPIQSLSSTGRNSPISSPKSPPNSPNTEPAAVEDKLNLQGVYINRDPELDIVDNSRTSSCTGSHSKAWSMPRSEFKKEMNVSGHVLATLVISHILAVGLGVTLGYWVIRRRGGAGQ